MRPDCSNFLVGKEQQAHTSHGPAVGQRAGCFQDRYRTGGVVVGTGHEDGLGVVVRSGKDELICLFNARDGQFEVHIGLTLVLIGIVVHNRARDAFELGAKIVRRLLLRLVTASLPEPDQEILGMRIFENLAWIDIAEILECDRVTARKRCGEAIKRLERLLR